MDEWSDYFEDLSANYDNNGQFNPDYLDAEEMCVHIC